MALGIHTYWLQTASDAFAGLKSSVDGLTQNEAELRLKSCGQNVISEKRGIGTARMLIRQFESPLVLILIFGATVSILLMDWMDAAIIISIVLGSTCLGFVQEHRAAAAIKRLRASLALNSIVLRDGRPRTIDSRCIVPGDVIVLSAGNVVPADGLILSARDFLVTQAALTGESLPVEKYAGRASETASLIQRTNAVFLGTSVRSGIAKVLVTRTGRATELAAIAGAIAKEPETEFERGVRRFGYLLTRIMLAIVIFAFTVNLFLDRPLIGSLLFSVALAVGLTPELLPAIVSVTLSAGARRMAARGVIVRRLDAIENLGSVDILCTDKTGTLTKGIVALSAAVDADFVVSDDVFRCAAINSRLETGIENPLDAAIVEEAERRGVSVDLFVKIDEIPYDFLRKRLTIVVAPDNLEARHLIITKGAFDTVMGCCDRIATARGLLPMNAELAERLGAYYRTKGIEGFRVLGLATRETAPKKAYDRQDETGMIFQGFLLFFDPLKEGIAETVREFTALGIATKIISGDSQYVAAHVGAAIGLESSRLLTGQQINETGDEALWNLVEQTEIFAEVEPQQIERIVHALQNRGHVIAYLADGINDVPALRAADAGISVDQAVDVARESADIVLLGRDLDALKESVIDGRRTFANTLKYIAITTSANFGNMVSMAVATLFVPFLPLLAKQILLNNFLSDLPAISLSTDNVDRNSTERAQRWNIREIQLFMLVFGLISTAFDLLTFAVLVGLVKASEPLFQSTWFMISLLTELAALFVLRTRLACWRSRPSALLVSSSLVIAVLAIGIPYAGTLAEAFGFVAVPFPLVVFAAFVVVFYAAATEAAKRWYYARISGR